MLKYLKSLHFVAILICLAIGLTGCSMSGGESGTTTSGTGGGDDSSTTVVVDNPDVEPPGALGDLEDIGDLLEGIGDNWYFTRVIAIGEDGSVVGQSNNSSPVKAAFVWDATTEAMSYIGIHPGGPYSDYYYLLDSTPEDWLIYSEAVGISSLGDIICNSTTGTDWPEETEKRAFYFDGVATYVDLSPGYYLDEDDPGIFITEKFSEAMFINDDYVLVDRDDKDGRHAYYWDKTSTVSIPVRAEDDSVFNVTVPIYESLGRIISADSSGVAINDYNQAIVNSENTVVFHDIDIDVIETLNHLPGASSTVAVAINNSQPTGHVAGTSDDEAFFWDGGAMYPCGDLGGGTSEATDINNNDQVVGNSTTASGATHAFIWELNIDGEGEITDLGTLGGSNSWAIAINDNGLIIGYSETGETYTQGTLTSEVIHSCVWYDNVIYDLGIHNDFYTYPFIQSFPFSEAVAINNNNRITGNSYTINSHSRGFILDPDPLIIPLPVP